MGFLLACNRKLVSCLAITASGVADLRYNLCIPYSCVLKILELTWITSLYFMWTIHLAACVAIDSSRCVAQCTYIRMIQQPLLWGIRESHCFFACWCWFTIATLHSYNSHVIHTEYSTVYTWQGYILFLPGKNVVLAQMYFAYVISQWWWLVGWLTGLHSDAT